MTAEQASLVFFWVATAVLLDRGIALLLVRAQVQKAVSATIKRNKVYNVLVLFVEWFEIVCMGLLLGVLGVVLVTFSVRADASASGLAPAVIGVVGLALSILGSLLVTMAEGLDSAKGDSMAICGYNEVMGRGLREFFSGVTLALEEKAKREGMPLRAVFERELVEIPQINAGLTDSNHPSHGAFLGLNTMVLVLFKNVLGDAGDSTMLGERLRREVEAFVKVLEDTEEQADRLATQGIDDPVKRAAALGDWLKGQTLAE